MKFETATLFKTIPVVTVLFCLGYGIYLLTGNDEITKTLSGTALIFTSVFCFLWSIFPASIGTYKKRQNSAAKKSVPLYGYIASLALIVIGIMLLNHPEHFIAGHIACGLGLAAWSTATITATVARSQKRNNSTDNPTEDSVSQQKLWLEISAAFPVLATWTWAVLLLSGNADESYYIAGHIMGAIACLCTALLASFAAVLRQKQNGYLRVIAFAAIIWGVVQFALQYGQPTDFVGFILIGSGIVCWSLFFPIAATVIPARAEEQKNESIALFPFVLFIICLLISLFLFEEAGLNAKFLFPARMFLGFGAFCLTSFAATGLIQIRTRQ